MSTKELQLQDAKNITLYASWKANSFYLYKPSDYENTYRVDDDGKTVKFTFYVDGNQTKVPTTGDTGQNPAVYHMNMTNHFLRCDPPELLIYGGHGAVQD